MATGLAAYRVVFAEALTSASAPITPRSFLDVNPDLTQLTWTSDLSGGWQGLQLGFDRRLGTGKPLQGLRRSRLAVDQQIDGLQHVEVWRGGQLCWAGRVAEVDEAGDEIRGVQAQGYGTWATKDGLWFAPGVTEASGAEALTTGQILQQIVPTAAPVLRLADGFTDPGVRQPTFNFDAKSLEDALQVFRGQATTTGHPCDFYVYEARVLQVVPRIAPDFVTSVPDYGVPLDPQTVQVKRIFTDLCGQVQLQGQGELFPSAHGSVYPSGSDFQNGDYAARFPGLTLQRSVSVGDAFAGSADVFGYGIARAYADAYLAVHSRPTVSASVSRSGGQGLEQYGPGGVELPPERVRAGQWVQLGEAGIDPAAPQYLGPLVIVRAQFDASSGTLTAELGAKAPSLPNLLAGLRELAGHALAARNVNSRL